MKNRSIAIWVVGVAAASVLVGCGKQAQPDQSAGEQSSEEQMRVVSLKEVLAAPETYKDKEVVVAGNFGGACCATDFFLKDGLVSCEVYPQDQQPIPDVKLGKPIRVQGTVRAQKKGDEYTVKIESTNVETQ